MDVVVTASDLDAGYAADGYARIKGLAALSVTYGVGTMSLLAVIGGAYAPVVTHGFQAAHFNDFAGVVIGVSTSARETKLVVRASSWLWLVGRAVTD